MKTIDKIIIPMAQKPSFDTIGHGGFGITYKAPDLQTGKLVCLKWLACLGASTANAPREIEILKQLRHPNIVEYYGFSRHENSLFIVMEYIDGLTLRQLIDQREAPLTEKEVLNIAHQLTFALQYCHDHNVIHCDVKSENIIMTKENRIKLIDFGLARVANGAMSSRVVMVFYMSPEMVNEADYSFSVDIWGIGVLSAFFTSL
jgi:serine/threonine protein kinase